MLPEAGDASPASKSAAAGPRDPGGFIMGAFLRRPRQFFVPVLVAAVLASVGSLGVLIAPAASAVVPTLHETTTVACNNTFNGTKFPLQYLIDSTPSANPVAPGASFTVDFHVT